jgi:hypothetical protein
MDWDILLGTGRRRVIQGFSSYIHLCSAASTIAANFQVSHWLSFLSPIVLTIGIYLIRSGSYIGDFAFHGDGENTIKDSKDFFDVAIKLYGLYLIAAAIPSCIWLLANVLIVLRAAPYLSVDNEVEGIQSYLLSVLTTLGLGMCCFMLSNRLTGLAFRRRETSGG